MISPGIFIFTFLTLYSVDDWKLIKNDNEVQTYVRWIKNGEGKEYRERKGEMTVKCSVDDVVSFLTDPGSTKKWMPGVQEHYIITRINKKEWYTYTLFDIPWPFNKRDLVSLNTMTSDSLNNIAGISIVSKDKYIPLKTGITRLIDYKANWSIKGAGEKNTRIIFNATSSTPPILPRYIQDPIMERIFHNNLVHLHNILSKKE